MEKVRSLLFVPGDSERKIAKALSSEADAIVLDLEDAVLPGKRSAARELCLSVLKTGSSKKLFVRVNAISTEDHLADLALIIRGQPYGVMLPKCRSAIDMEIADRYLAALEVRDGVAAGSTKVLPIVTETGASLFGAANYNERSPRLVGMLWGGEDLAADIGATINRDTRGNYRPLFELARSVCLLAAGASRVGAVDAVFTNFRDLDGLRIETEVAARDGFTSKAAIHPDQVPIINEVFTPSAAELARAKQVLELFERDGGAGTVSFEGRMLDRPHLIMASRLLRRAL